MDDIAAMLGEGSPREALVASIKVGSEELECDLKKFILYSKASDLKIVSFKESMNTRKLKKVCQDISRFGCTTYIPDRN